MSDIAVKVENLSKKYVIGAKDDRFLYERITNGFKSLFSRNGKKKETEFWALRDINLEIKQGDVVGIIGKNGAGKSTLLKIISRITQPTTGRITIKGKVASILEVGTGMNRELTGRENIFINSAILGMKQAEIRKKFDEIVAFSGVEKFIDTPIKHYSSGMYVRLAFAIAAHLEPDILIIDEVLAVGDAEFQKKCLGKMDDVAKKQGRTVLFVSHSMPMIASLCKTVFMLHAGRLVASGEPSDVILEYYKMASSMGITNEMRNIGDDTVTLLDAYVKNHKGEIVTEVEIDEPITIGLRYRIRKNREIDENLFTYPQLNFQTVMGQVAFVSMAPVKPTDNTSQGEYIAECVIPANLLNAQTYYVSLGMATCGKGVKVHFYLENVLMFNVREDLDKTLLITRNNFSGHMPGVVRPSLNWSTRGISEMSQVVLK
jgi:lipopolysaccharide transport system ATP-binding protein